MIEFRLLGPVEARDGAGAVGLGPAQRRGLLAMLLLEAGRPVPVERLVEGLWGAAAPGSARKMVQAHVSALRKRLGAEAVRTAGGGYAAYPGHRRHLFPDCYCCGPRRSAADGLRVFPAPLPGRGMVAALWVPHGEAGPERAWAALDCPAIWALIAAARPGSPDRIVTGTMRGELRAELVPGELYVAYAWVEGAAGRRRMTGAALADARGEVVAVNHQVFVTVAAGVPLDPRRWRLP